MEELGRRYPRIASLVQRNVNELLASRLAFHIRGQQLGEAFESRTVRYVDPLLDEGVATDLGDPALQSSLVALGIQQRTVRALGLIPMVEVAWADGKLDDKERQAILDASDALGIERNSESYDLLAEWLAAAPSAALFRAWRDYVESLVGRLSVEGRLRLRDSVLGRARAVAEAAGGVVGMGTVSRHEERVIAELGEIFEEPAD